MSDKAKEYISRIDTYLHVQDVDYCRECAQWHFKLVDFKVGWCIPYLQRYNRTGCMFLSVKPYFPTFDPNILVVNLLNFLGHAKVWDFYSRNLLEYSLDA